MICFRVFVMVRHAIDFLIFFALEFNMQLDSCNLKAQGTNTSFRITGVQIAWNKWDGIYEIYSNFIDL